MTVRVAITRCGSYAPGDMRPAVNRIFDMLAIAPEIFSNRLVVLKPNLLSAVPAETAVVTHPELFRAVAVMVKESGGRPVLAESPGTLSLMKVFEATGYRKVIDEEGIEVADMGTKAVIPGAPGRGYQKFEIAEIFLKADYIINLPKLKTHGLTYLTFAVKNLFGMIPGLDKAAWHAKAPSPELFSGFLLDYYGALMKNIGREKFIHVGDAVKALEGDGPGTSGSPVDIGALIGGLDGAAVDHAGVLLSGLDMEKAVTVTGAFSRGLGGPAEAVEILGEDPAALKPESFMPPSVAARPNILGRKGIVNAVKYFLTERPALLRGKCVRCGQCVRICPVGAASSGRGGYPRFDTVKCIRCLCCSEICPEAAVKIKKGMFQGLLQFFQKIK